MIEQEKVSPGNLTAKMIRVSELEVINYRCPCCNSENVAYEDWEFTNEFAIERFICEDCESAWGHYYSASHIHVFEDTHNTYQKYLAENRDKQIDEILKD